MAWTLFWDMHSGGRTKVWEKDGSYFNQYDHPDGAVEKELVYIEAPEEEARIIFYNRFGHNADRVTCTCCGEDYSVSESESLAESSAFHRGCMYVKDIGYVEQGEPNRNWKTYRSLEVHVTEPNVLILRKENIRPEERVGDVPRQGFVWVD